LPHRDEYYMVVLQQSGRSVGLVDFKEVILEENNVMITLPGQVHQMTYSDAQGWVIGFDTAYMEENCHHFFMEYYHETIHMQLPHREFQILQQLAENLSEYLSKNELPRFGNITKQALLTVLMSRIAGIFHEQKNNSLIGHTKRFSEIVQQFRHLLHNRFREVKSPAAYASQMHISTSYLNDTVKEMTGFPISYWIQQEVIMEMKRLLIYSNKNIKEIAIELNYEDEKYLHRLFKKVSGETPGNFRKKYGK
jgi:AraC family transcriptional regulator, transcriptional activator of pobA